MTKYEIKNTTQFKKDYKLAKRRGLDINLLKGIITKLANGEVLAPKHKDHPLSGDWVGHRECHIQPDWLLVYRYDNDVLVLTLSRTGTHSDLFGLKFSTSIFHSIMHVCIKKPCKIIPILQGFCFFLYIMSGY